jgi:Zn-dependent peptidase ImmA (M78 family)
MQGTGDTVNSAMLILARESREWTQTDLAGAIGVSQAVISRYETEMRTINSEHLQRIAEALNYPVDFFYRRGERFGLGSSGLYHRKRKMLPDRKLDSFIARVNIFRINVTDLVRAVDIEHPRTFPSFDPVEFKGDIEGIAEAVRAAWKFPSGPVADLVGAIEDAGGIVHYTFYGTQKIDALAQWIKPSPPVFLLNSDFPGDRLRFTLAHEIGHLVMHDVPTADIEDQADAFASALLMPRRDIVPELAPVTLPHMAQLKQRWRVSMAALIRRARDLEVITERQYRSLQVELNRNGYKTAEPDTVAQEKPTLLKEILDVHTNDLGYTVAEVAKTLAIDEAELRREYFPQTYRLHLLATPPVATLKRKHR